MSYRNNLLQQLSKLLSRKQSMQYYAKRLGVTVAEVVDLMQELKAPVKNPSTSQKQSFDEPTTKRVNVNKGEIEVNGYWNHEPSPEEIMQAHGIDQETWKLSQYWSKQKAKGFQVSALFAQKRATKEDIRESFLEFLKNYKPAAPVVRKEKKKAFLNTNNSCLVINKQDSHLNKYDVSGDNDIQGRFSALFDKIEKTLYKASISSNLAKVVYVVGSDEFNSEHNGMTVHGTPQVNALPFHQGFEAICGLEVAIIDLILTYADDVEILYVPGNHDEFVGWHLISWLKAYYRNVKNLTIDTEPNYTKYVKFSNTALCFNHGYKVKPEELVQNFPVQFKEHWSSCDHFYVFLGDKHTELTKQIGGVNVYRLSQTSRARSSFDAERGYDLCKGELTAFLIEEGNGLTDIYKQIV